MTVQIRDSEPIAGRFLKAIKAAGFERTPDATLRDAIEHLAANPCEIGFVAGDCLSGNNRECLGEVTGGEPCWPCFARQVLQIVDGRQPREKQ